MVSGFQTVCCYLRAFFRVGFVRNYVPCSIKAWTTHPFVQNAGIVLGRVQDHIGDFDPHGILDGKRRYIFSLLLERLRDDAAMSQSTDHFDDVAVAGDFDRAIDDVRPFCAMRPPWSVAIDGLRLELRASLVGKKHQDCSDFEFE